MTWFHLKGYGRVFAYNAEDSDDPQVGLSHGFIHFGRSEKAEDRLGFCGVDWFARNASADPEGGDGA